LEKLSSQARILRTIAGEPVDRVPVFAPLTYHPLSPPPAPGDWKETPEYLQLLELAKQNCDFFAQLEIPERIPFRNSRAHYGMHGIPEGIFDRRFFLVPPETVEAVGEEIKDQQRLVHYKVHTPCGALTTTESVHSGEDTVWELEPLIKDVEDVHKLLSVPHRFDHPDMSKYIYDRERLGMDGVAVIFVSSPLVMISRLTGFQRLLEWTITEPELVDRLMHTVAERIGERLRYILTEGAGPIIRFGGCEQATPPMMSGRSFDHFILKYEAPLWEMVRRAGKICWVHCHGRVGSVIDKFRDHGVQLLDPVEPPPQGDIEFEKAKLAACQGPMTLIGNIEWSWLETLRPDEIEIAVKQAIEAGGKTHMILGCSAEVISAPSQQVCSNIQMFIQSGAYYGRSS
jgi:uroporphyrinogen-III decarboxylase